MHLLSMTCVIALLPTPSALAPAAFWESRATTRWRGGGTVAHQPALNRRRVVPIEMQVDGLAARLAVDCGAAAITAAVVAPLIAAIDEAITRSASGGDKSLWDPLLLRLKSIFISPCLFFASKAFQWMWLVYAITYLTASGLRTIQDAFGLSLGIFATVLLTIINVSLNIAKDSAFSQMFGCDEDGCMITPKRAYVTWFLRDLIAFTFILTLPPIVSSTLGLNLAMSYFFVPIVGQYFTTPLHLLGFSLCNMPDASKSRCQ